MDIKTAEIVLQIQDVQPHAEKLLVLIESGKPLNTSPEAVEEFASILEKAPKCVQDSVAMFSINKGHMNIKNPFIRLIKFIAVRTLKQYTDENFWKIVLPKMKSELQDSFLTQCMQGMIKHVRTGHDKSDPNSIGGYNNYELNVMIQVTFSILNHVLNKINTDQPIPDLMICDLEIDPNGK